MTETRTRKATPDAAAPHPWYRRPLAVAAGAALALTILVGSVALFFGGGEAPTDRGVSPSSESAVPTSAVPSTSVASDAASGSVPEVMESPWVAPGEIRIGSTVITADSITADEGVVTLRYDVTSLAPMNAVLQTDDVRLSAPVLPDRWSLETNDGTVMGTTSWSGNEVRFETDSSTTVDDIVSVELVSWKTIVPVSYDITVDAETRTPTRLPDGSEIVVSTVYASDDEVAVTFDITTPADQQKVVACGGIRGLGSSCYDPVPGTGWIHREADTGLSVMAPVGTALDAIPLRYQRPTWTVHEGSKPLGLSSEGTAAGDATDFPVGFVAIDDNEAIAPIGITRYGNRLLVSFISATRRGVDPTSFDPLIGGGWALDLDSGDSIESTGMAYNDRVPGAFSVIFPLDEGTTVTPTQLRLVERWIPVKASGATDTGPVASSVGSLGSPPVAVDLDGGTRILVERFDRVGVGGYAVWSSAGDPPMPVIADVTGSIIDPDGTPVVTTESWIAPIRHFGLSNTGRQPWFWLSDSDDSVDSRLAQGNHHLVLRVDAEVPQVQPADIAIDISNLPQQ